MKQYVEQRYLDTYALTLVETNRHNVSCRKISWNVSKFSS